MIASPPPPPLMNLTNAQNHNLEEVWKELNDELAGHDTYYHHKQTNKQSCCQMCCLLHQFQSYNALTSRLETQNDQTRVQHRNTG